MNCTCIEDLQKKLIADGYDDKPVEEAAFNEFAFILSDIGNCSYNTIDITYSGAKRPKSIKIMHTYCPFCGTKISKD